MSPRHNDIPLPAENSGIEQSLPEKTRRVTIIGGNGAGKSLFMEEMVRLCGDRAYVLSALDASLPASDDIIPGSIDDLYRIESEKRNYMKGEAVSRLDKLSYMLFVDELESLLAFKENLSGNKNVKLPLTKIDRVKGVWEKVFPGSRIRPQRGTLMFDTGSGDDLVSISRLSQGEKTVLFYTAAVLFAMQDAVIFIDSPTLFLHPSIIGSFWNKIERMRPDCTFIYNSVDVDFIQSRMTNTCIWVKSYDSAKKVWDYQILKETPLSEELFVELAGSRKPVLFIEGDSHHSIDAKLYQLVFPDWIVRPLGSCNKVIETTRTFNDLKYMHHLRSRGLIDRDRRTEAEVAYLRNKEIMVPDVAEIENIFLLEPVMRIMAKRKGKNPEKVVVKIKKSIIDMFRRHADAQALQHVRHRVKREVECKIDARFTCITALETHLKTLIYKLQPRKHYNELRSRFLDMIKRENYPGILQVFNHKPMLPDSGIHQLLGYRSKEEYISGVLDILRDNSEDAAKLREAIQRCFHLDNKNDTDKHTTLNQNISEKKKLK